jgi:hypothetical protein
MLAQKPEGVMFSPDHQSAERGVMIATKFFSNVAELKYFGTTVTKKYFIRGIKSR